MDKPYERITCPFCFNAPKYGGTGRPFSHMDVHFRVSDDSVTTQESCSFDSGSLARAASAIISGIEDVEEDSFKRKPDDIYQKFWKELTCDIPQLMNPVITASEYQIDTSSFSVAGMLVSVLDMKGNRTNERLCPFCHTSLPPNYGQFATKFISVIGTMCSGTTVYLSQLLKHSFSLLQQSCGIVASLSPPAKAFYHSMNPVQCNEQLPCATTPYLWPSSPISVDLLGTKDPLTLVFYDVAGENCIDTEKMQTYGFSIAHSDAVIMLIAPEQFRDLTLNDSEPEFWRDPSELLDVMYTALMKPIYDGEPAPIPIAITLSQSDLLLKSSLFHQSSNIFKAIQYPTRGFRADVQLSLAMDLRRKLFSKAFASKASYLFSQIDFFAVSALGLGTTVENGTLKTNASCPHRIEEPLLWILHQFEQIPAKGIVQRFVRATISVEPFSDAIIYTSISRTITAKKESLASFLPGWRLTRFFKFKFIVSGDGRVMLKCSKKFYSDVHGASKAVKEIFLPTDCEVTVSLVSDLSCGLKLFCIADGRGL